MIRAPALLVLVPFAVACQIEVAAERSSAAFGSGVAAALDGVGGAPGACADASYVQAPPETPACGSGGVCDVDADCAAFGGNYCQASVCAVAGCLRGWCTPTRVMGEPCDRDAECATDACQKAPDGGMSVCAPGGGMTLPGPFP